MEDKTYKILFCNEHERGFFREKGKSHGCYGPADEGCDWADYTKCGNFKIRGQYAYLTKYHNDPGERKYYEWVFTSDIWYKIACKILDAREEKLNTYFCLGLDCNGPVLAALHKFAFSWRKIVKNVL